MIAHTPANTIDGNLAKIYDLGDMSKPIEKEPHMDTDKIREITDGADYALELLDAGMKPILAVKGGDKPSYVTARRVETPEGETFDTYSGDGLLETKGAHAKCGEWILTKSTSDGTPILPSPKPTWETIGGRTIDSATGQEVHPEQPNRWSQTDDYFRANYDLDERTSIAITRPRVRTLIPITGDTILIHKSWGDQIGRPGGYLNVDNPSSPYIVSAEDFASTHRKIGDAEEQVLRHTLDTVTSARWHQLPTLEELKARVQASHTSNNRTPIADSGLGQDANMDTPTDMTEPTF